MWLRWVQRQAPALGIAVRQLLLLQPDGHGQVRIMRRPVLTHRGYLVCVSQRLDVAVWALQAPPTPPVLCCG